MKNFVLLFTVFYQIVTPSNAGGRKRFVEPTQSPSPISSPEPSPIPSPEPSPVLSTSKGRIGFKCASCNESEKKRVADAEKVANEVVQTVCFSNFMINWGLLDENGNRIKDPKKVVTHLQTAKLTVPVHYYYSRQNVVGYRNVGEPDIYFNRKYHNYYGACDTASNAVHEWSHVLDYGHPFNNTSWRGRTVPYAINNAFEACCEGSKGLRGF